MTVLLFSQKFLSHYTMILSRDHRHLSFDKSFFIAKSVASYISENIFSLLNFSEIVQYLSACNIANIAHLNYIDIRGKIF